MAGSNGEEMAQCAELDVSGLTENHKEIIASAYGLADAGRHLVGDLTKEEMANAGVDIAFASSNPSIPAENVLSRLDNYIPRSLSQTELLGQATRLAIYRNPRRLAGLIACGTAGLGKTHISVGVAKQAMLVGQTARYINIPSLRRPLNDEIANAMSADIVIVDDLNDGRGTGRTLFRGLIAAMHNRGGGKLLVTSNYVSPELLIGDLTAPIAGDTAESLRLRDRIGGALLGLVVEGESYRQQSTGEEVPWWLET